MFFCSLRESVRSTGKHHASLWLQHGCLKHMWRKHLESKISLNSIQLLLLLPCPSILPNCGSTSFCLFSTLLALLHVSKSGITLAATVLGNHGSKQRVSTHTLQSLLITFKSMCWCVELRPVDLLSVSICYNLSKKPSNLRKDLHARG
jgi:hypothetical protein